MILLQQNQPNKVALTLNELANPNDPSNWLFIFELDQSQGDGQYSKRVQLLEVSSTSRYNYFEITEGADITFDLVGDYSYAVYQMPDDISINELDGVLVENGKMRLFGLDELEYINSVATNTYINE
jgi:hypothetical protein